MVTVIIGSRTADATEAGLIKAGNALNLKADGYIGGVQMTLYHGADFSIELTDKAMVADYRTNANSTTLIIVAPESNDLFEVSGDFSVEEIIVANANSEVSIAMPTELTLSQAYPNPFNPSTTLSLSVQNATPASIMAYDITGRLVDVVFEGTLQPSDNMITWNASNLPSGVYIVTLSTPNGSASMQKVMLMK